jgi:hypothetical protein
VQSTSTILSETERLALVITIREHPEWLLADLLDRVDAKDHHADLLRQLTVQELMSDPGVELAGVRLARARRATGDAFDQLALAVLIELWPKPVAASELRARVGGPRWKLQASLGRLVAAKRAVRTGNTSGARYTAVKNS